MVVYPVFARHGRSLPASITAKAAPLLARFVGNLMLTILLAAVIGIALGGIAGFFVVIALW